MSEIKAFACRSCVANVDDSPGEPEPGCIECKGSGRALYRVERCDECDGYGWKQFTRYQEGLVNGFSQTIEYEDERPCSNCNRHAGQREGEVPGEYIGPAPQRIEQTVAELTPWGSGPEERPRSETHPSMKEAP